MGCSPSLLCKNRLGVKMPPFLWKDSLGFPLSKPPWPLQPLAQGETRRKFWLCPCMGRLWEALSHRVIPLCAGPGLPRPLQNPCSGKGGLRVPWPGAGPGAPPFPQAACACTECVKPAHEQYSPVFVGTEQSPAELKGSEEWGLSESHLIMRVVLARLSPTHMPFHA